MFSCFKNLELYAQNGMNCLLIGPAGVGKTAYVKALFDKIYGKEWKYFSSSTLDVFIDFLGIPRDCLDDDDCHIIDYIKPKWHKYNIKALFLDEFNRSPKKMRNAVLELLQFKTLNGEQFGNLQTIFAAINPEEDSEYSDVEKLDKAQVDRFEIHIDVPYLLDLDYFENRYDKDTADAASEWWNSLDDEIRKNVSPRRLQYAIDVFKIGGSLKEVLPKSSNHGKLLENLKLGSLTSRIEQLFTEKDDKIKEEMKNPNIETYIKRKLKDPKYVAKFAKHLSQEAIMMEAPNNFDMCSYIKDNRMDFDISLVNDLDQLGCFKESDFRCCFALMKKHFADNKYSSNKRIHIKKVMQSLPNMSTIKVRTSDIPQLQTMLSLFGEYTQISNYNTPTDDDNKFKYISKLSELWELSDTMKLGLDMSQSSMYQLKNLISRYRNDVIAQQAKAQAASQNQQQNVGAGPGMVGGVGSNPAPITPNPILRANPVDVFTASGQPLGKADQTVSVGNGGAVVLDPNGLVKVTL